MKKIEELEKKGKTVIVISHFLDDDKEFDKILFFKGKGRYSFGTVAEMYED
jgi:ABC-type multidrug transport system ATPase subunit